MGNPRRLINAAKVIYFTKHIKDYLQVHDPMALRQLKGALEEIGETDTGDGPPRIKMYEVWYAKEPNFSVKETRKQILEAGDLSKTHCKVREIDAINMEEIFFHMQAEFWSPHGEAKQLIKALGLQYTSMSVGDVVIDGGDKYIVGIVGFEKL
jgi:hypothetical protein